MPVGMGVGLLGRLILSLLMVLLTLLSSAVPVRAADVAVILSADVDAYSEALKGFKAALRHKIVAEYSMDGDFDRGRKQVSEISAKVKPDLIFAVGICLIAFGLGGPASKLRYVMTACGMYRDSHNTKFFRKSCRSLS